MLLLLMLLLLLLLLKAFDIGELFPVSVDVADVSILVFRLAAAICCN